MRLSLSLALSLSLFLSLSLSLFLSLALSLSLALCLSLSLAPRVRGAPAHAQQGEIRARLGRDSPPALLVVVSSPGAG